MKARLEKPEMEMVMFEAEDIITTSACYPVCETVCVNNCITICDYQCHPHTN